MLATQSSDTGRDEAAKSETIQKGSNIEKDRKKNQTKANKKRFTTKLPTNDMEAIKENKTLHICRRKDEMAKKTATVENRHPGFPSR
jgi:hypothetical protein